MTNDAMEYKSESQATDVDEDEMLISAAKESVEAFGRLYDKYYDDIFRYIYHRTFDYALTGDLASDTFLKAFRHIRRYKWKGIPFNAWLHQIATNEIRMHYRKETRISTIGLQIPNSSTDGNPASVEDYAFLHQAILKLKPMHQTVIALHFFEDMTIPEISEIVGRKAGTVKSRLHRGLRKLKEILEQQEVLSPGQNGGRKNG